MTATNHALTGAVVALVLKKPELAIPAAFASHFVVDLIPHYNPSGLTKDKFKSYSDSWKRKMRMRSFRIIFASDMLLFGAILIILPLLISGGRISAWTIFFSSLAAASPDFDGGIKYLRSLFFPRRKSKENNGWFTKFHIRLQWMERPWGIYVELAWCTLMIVLISQLRP